MEIRFSIIKAISLLFFVSIACSVPFSGNDIDSASQSKVESGVLFRDNFSDKNSGWSRYSDPGGITDYENGIYRIYVSEAYWDYWAIARCSADLVHYTIRIHIN